MQDLNLDSLVISKAKLKNSFPNRQFYLNGCKIRGRRDRNSYDRRLVEYVKKHFWC